MSRSNYALGFLELAPGRYRMLGFVPMTGLLLDKWIQVGPDNPPGCYGAANLAIATAIPNLVSVEDDAGREVWRLEERSSE